MKTLTIVFLLVCAALAVVLKTDAQPVTTIYSFINGPAKPLAGLTLGNDGNFYGTTESGGLNNEGTAFKMTTNGITTTLVNFGTTYGSPTYPEANLTLGPDGNFYGTTSQGGTNTSGTNATGTVFKMTTNGTVTILVSFNGVNGGIPLAGLTLAPDGNFYGTTEFGGTNGDGTVFKLTTNGTLTTLVNFNGTNGANPLAGLAAGPGGNLYGTTRYGGTNQNLGTVFQVTTNGTFTTLIQFAGTNGAWPYGGVTVGPDGNLYGTTTWAGNPNGDFNGGTIFELTTNGLLTTLIRFVDLGGTNGLNPETSLTLGPDGNFYGTTFAGGANGNGTVFQVTTNGILATLTQAGIPFQTLFTPQGYEYYTTNNWVTSAKVSNGTLTTLYSFSAQTNGNNPDGANLQSTLALGPDGNFYGTAPAGGANGYGTAFKVTTNGTFTTLATFSGNHGDNLMDALTTGPDGSLYGTANTGGTSGYGTVFKLTTGGALTTLVNFDRANDGANPQAGLIVGPGGNFYGTAVGGGTNLLQTGPNSYNAESFGTVFELTTNGIFTPLAYFSGTNGANPYGGLAFGLDGNLYGTTTYGGISNNGVVFQLLTNGTLTALTNFTGANGANPFASLTLGPDGNFYGTCEAGGTNNDGTVFQVTTNGALTTLVNFNGTNGANPNAGLLLGPDGNFYGTAYFGGARNEGTVFKVTTGGTLTTLVNFAQTNGEFPVGGLALGPDGNFYGTTELGGTLPSSGTVFKLATNGVLTTLYGFVFSSTSPNGNYPFAGLTLVTNGNFIHFYGTTYEGPNGPSGGGGTIFRVNLTTAYAMPENSTNTFFPLTNEVAWTTGGTLSLVNAAATNGTGQITGSGIVFKPTANFIGTATINYAVTNNAGGTNVSLITVLVTNVPPVANPDVYTVAENSSANVLSPLTNDVTETSGGVLSLVSVSPTNGTAVISGTNVLFTPQANFTGTATIGYTITDNVGGTNSSLITVTVTVANSISVVTITAPTSGQVVSNAAFTVTGTAAITGNPLATLTNVYVQLNNGGWTGAISTSGWTNWTASVTLTAGSNTVSAYAVDAYGNVSPTNSVTFDYVTNSGALFAGPPGTPVSGFRNTGGQSIIVEIGGGIGVQPIINVLFSANATAFAGDIVFLINANNGNNPTNWAAVLRFINPGDPTGTNGLAATEYETYFQTNAGPNYFAGFSLLPNVDYLPIASTNADGSITADAVVFGPVGAIIAGQEAIMDYTASIQPGTNADLSLIASAAPEPVGVGSNLVYSLTISNAGPATATGVIVSNQIPANVTFVSATGGATPTNSVLLVNLGSLAEGTNTSVQIVVQPTAAGSLTNNFQVFANELDPNLTNNSATVVSTVTNATVPVSADLILTVSDASPVPTLVGNYLEYDFVISNAGPYIATGVVFSNQLPASVPYGGAPRTNGPLAGLQFYNLGTLDVGGITSFRYLIQPPAITGKLTNLFRVFADQNDPVLTNNSVTMISPLTNAPVLVGIPGSPYAGSWMAVLGGSATNRYENQIFPSTFFTSLQVSTAAGSYAAGFSPSTFGIPASNAIPGDIVLLLNPTGGNNPTNWQAVVRFFNPADPTGSNHLAASESQAFIQPDFSNFKLFTSVAFYPSIVAGSEITASFQEIGPMAGILAAQSDVVTITVANSNADLSLSAIAAPEPVGVGSNLVYSLTFSNAGPTDATDVIISNRLPAGVTFVSATGGATPSGGVLLMNLGSLTNGAVGSAQIVVQPITAGQLTNSFQVFADQTDPVLTNNFGTVVSTVTNAPVVNQGIPGTPTASWDASSQVVIGEGGGIGVQTIMQTLAIPSFSFTATPGNIVMLINPNGGNNVSNWKAVVNFFNPSDPTGTNGLAATDYQTFFPTNAGPNAFANVPLFTNVDYVPITTTNADGSITADIVENGPAGGILAGQQATIFYTASIQPGAGADLSLSASAAPKPVGVGSNLVYSLTVSNAGPATATGVIVSNQLPANVTFISATGGATPASGLLLVNLGSLAEGTNVSVQVVVQPTVAGSLTNNFQVFANEFDPNMTNNSASVVSTVTNAAVVASADLKLSASAAPEPVGVSSNLVYSITVSNAGPSAATGVVVSNQLPAGVNFVSATGGATPASGVLLLNLGSLASNAISSVQVIIQPTVAGEFTNLFQVFSSTTDPVLTNNSATVISTVTNAPVVAQADLKLTASAAPEPVTVGSNLVYSITVSNAGPSAATGVVVSNRVPVGVNFVSATGGATPSGGILLVNLGSLASNATSLAQIIVQPISAGKLTNQFRVFANETDPVLTNNSATVVSTVTNAPPMPVDVALSIMAAPNPVSVGAPLTYSLTVTNNSSTTATGVVVSNTLPPNVTVFSLLPSQGAATNQSGVVTYSVGSLPNDSAATLAIVVIPNAAGLLTNTASAFSLQTDSQLTNNYATNVTTAVSVPITNLVLTVLSAITLNPQTGLFEERIEVSNGGPATPSSVLVLISGLAANVKVYNATGTTNGLPYVQSSSPLGIGSNVVFLLEYYVPTRIAPTNLTLTVQAGPIVIPPVVTGTILSISRMIALDNGSVLVEFSAVPGQVYAIQYSSDMVTWLTAVPAIAAPANQVQWIDSGPPKTVSSPAQQGARYYRVILLTAH